MNKTCVLKAEGVRKSFVDGSNQVEVLKGVDFELYQGERVAIIGASGSGKSTLLSILGGLEDLSEGSVCLQGQEMGRLKESKRAKIRNQHLGFVYQFHHLLPEFSALENVAMPLLLRKQSIAEVKQKAIQLLTAVGLADRLSHKPSQLSGGERQRVAIARALVTEPACVLMDEPTGNLDGDTALAVEALIDELSQQQGVAFVIVTHDLKVAERAQRTLRLEGGQLAAV
ncbi:MAG: lipoprotein-releasing ABC transporter ATP-binding protein LolD [Pontibacterium sp.]